MHNVYVTISYVRGRTRTHDNRVGSQASYDLILSRHTGRHLIAITNIALSHKVHACQLTAKSGQEICQKSEHKK